MSSRTSSVTDIRYIETSENTEPSKIEKILVTLALIIFILTFPVSIWFSLVTANEYQRAVIFRLGRLKKGGARGPGIFFVIPIIDSYVKVDLRTISFDILPQEILTRDSVTISVDAVIYYRIMDPLKAVIQVAYVREATHLLAQTTLRNVTSTKGLMEFLSDKELTSRTICEILDKATDPWGVKVERVEIKDVRLPIAMQRAMAAEAEASREAKAKIVAAQGELNASKALKEASDVMAENPITLQLRYLQTLNIISNRQNHSIIFPFPVDVLRKLFYQRQGGGQNDSFPYLGPIIFGSSGSASSNKREDGARPPSDNHKDTVNEGPSSQRTTRNEMMNQQMEQQQQTYAGLLETLRTLGEKTKNFDLLLPSQQKCGISKRSYNNPGDVV